MGDFTDHARWFVAIGLLEHDAHRGPTVTTSRCVTTNTARPPRACPRTTATAPRWPA